MNGTDLCCWALAIIAWRYLTSRRTQQQQPTEQTPVGRMMAERQRREATDGN